ncbi:MULTISPECIES: response regulator transcription factor [unclassified Sporolactobacillus]|uniref:response regulator transcription factor n=1 Tax=unclassified Sporolactobacillus TaxID=2628533 RepID=UPI002368638B|nr:response regulator transcription factor [Sporolactobacillus sp. CQH2019]MDD9146934.1 response regulator transcription factor [Sporolactobacillus sp. CQH2019]
MFNILVVEDDLKLNKLFCTVLSRHGYHTFAAFDGAQALKMLDSQYIDLIISDIMMPKMDGYQLTKALRNADFNLPVLMITVKENFEDKRKGFLSGIDDYMVKPINVNEMVLRVQALLRRAKIVSEREIVCGSTRIVYDSQTVSFNGGTVSLPQKEFRLLYKLISFPNKIFTRQQLMEEIWGMDSETDERTVDVHINRLRDHLKACKDFQIKTVRGLGYKAVKYEK